MTLDDSGFSSSEGKSVRASDGSPNSQDRQSGWENAQTAAPEPSDTAAQKAPRPSSSHQQDATPDKRPINDSPGNFPTNPPPSSFEYSASKRRPLEHQPQHGIPRRQLYLFAGVGLFLLVAVGLFLLASGREGSETDIEATQSTTTSLVTLEIADSPTDAANPPDSPATTVDPAAAETDPAETDPTEPASAETDTTEAPEATTSAAPVVNTPVLGVLGSNKVSVAGEVSSEQTAVALVQLLKPLAGQGQVTSQLTVNPEAAPVKHLSISLADEVLFGAGSDSISPEFYPLLDQVVALMLASPSITVVVEGHTDSSGDEVENLSLSQRRAEAVVAYIADNKINRFRLEPRGRGSGEPIADNSSQDGRQRNRRIEFDIGGFDLTLASS